MHGRGELAFESLDHVGPNGVVCLAGLSGADRLVPVDVNQINQEVVLKNMAMFGSVNANRRHYEQAATALSRSDRGWLRQLITRPVPLERWDQALGVSGMT